MMKKFAVCAAFAASMFAGAAQASPLQVSYLDGVSPFGAEDFGQFVRIESYGYDGWTKAGRFDLVGDNGYGRFYAFCIDLAQNLFQGHTYVSRPDLFDSLTIDNVDRLFASAYNLITDDLTAAAFQVALWEIVADTPNGYDLDSGEFYTVQQPNGQEYTPNVEALADQYLAGLANAQTGTFSLDFLFSDTSQDIVVGTPIDPPHMPLPAGGVLLLGGLGGLAYMRRKKSKALAEG